MDIYYPRYYLNCEKWIKQAVLLLFLSVLQWNGSKATIVRHEKGNVAQCAGVLYSRQVDSMYFD